MRFFCPSFLRAYDKISLCTWFDLIECVQFHPPDRIGIIYAALHKIQIPRLNYVFQLTCTLSHQSVTWKQFKDSLQSLQPEENSLGLLPIQLRTYFTFILLLFSRTMAITIRTNGRRREKSTSRDMEGFLPWWIFYLLKKLSKGVLSRFRTCSIWRTFHRSGCFLIF